MAKITKRTVDALEPREREHVLWDDEIKGFGVRVRPSGRKTYIVKYRDRGRVVKVTIGPHGAISPAAARARAAEIVTAARTGKDLSGRDLRDAKAPTVAELGRRFLDEYVTDHCKPNTKRQYRKMVEGYILPRLGARRVPDVQRIDVVSLHHDMRATPTNANRMLATLSRMFAVAELWQMRPDGSNPCRNIKHFREERRERFLSDEEYRRLGEVLREVERTGGIGAAVGDRRDPPLDADGMPQGGDPDATVGTCRSGPGRATPAGLQNRCQDRPPGRPGDLGVAGPGARGRQSVGDHEPEAGRAAERRLRPVAPHSLPCRDQGRSPS